MGNWFTSEYDLYASIVESPNVSGDLLTEAFTVCRRKDFEQDIKDACDAIISAGSFEEASDSVMFLWNHIAKTIGVSEKMEKSL